MIRPVIIALLLALMSVPGTVHAAAARRAPRGLGLATLDPRSGRVVRRASPPTASLCLSHDGNTCYAIADTKRSGTSWHVVSFRPPDVRHFESVTERGSNELAVAPSPDEKLLLLLVEKQNACTLVVYDRASTKRTELVDGLDPERSQFAWSHDGRFIYYTAPLGDGTAMGLFFTTLTGEEHGRVPTGDGAGEPAGIDEFDVCRTRARLAAREAGTIRIFDDGTEAMTIEPGGVIEDIRLSPDGTKLAWGGRRVVIYDLTAKKTLAVSQPPADEVVTDHRPAWSPDGTRLVFDRVWRFGSHDGVPIRAALVVLDAEGGRATENPREEDDLHANIVWPRDGDRIVCERRYLDGPPAATVDATAPPALEPAPAGATWQRCSGLYGGRVDAFEMSPHDGRLIYAIQRGRLYASEDAGEQWRLVSQGLTDVAAHPTKPGVLYGTRADDGQVVRSQDNGATWEPYGPPQKGQHFHYLAVHPTSPNVIYGLAQDGRLSRLDEENAAELTKFDGCEHFALLQVDPRNPDLIVYVAQSACHMSTDGGKTWRTIEDLPEKEQVVLLVSDAQDNELVLAMTRSGRVYFTADGGETWDLYADPSSAELWTEPIQRRLTKSFPIVGREAVPWAAWYGAIRWAAADPKQRRRVYLPGWTKGVHRSDDGGATWQAASNGLGAMSLDDIAVLPGFSGRIVAVSAPLFVHTTDDDGETWTSSGRIGRTLGAVLGAHPRVPGLVLMAQRSGYIYRSEDSGTTWEPVLDGIAPNAPQFEVFLRFGQDDADHITVASRSWVVESTDRGKSWRLMARFEAADSAELRIGPVVATDAAVSLGIVRPARILQTRDRGKTWRALKGPHETGSLAALLGRPDDDRALCVLARGALGGRSHCLCVTSDLGKTWEARPLPDVGSLPCTLARHPLKLDTLAVAFGNGTVLVTRDEGRTWRDTGRGLPGGEAKCLAFGPTDNRLYAFLEGAGLYWIELPPDESE